MTNESLPGPGQDPTTHWINILRRAMGDEAASMELPIWEELPVPVPDAERQATIAMDTGFTEDEITQVEQHPGGGCSITTVRRDEFGTDTTYLTFKLYGAPPQVGDTARLYRADVGKLPRGLIFPGGNPDDSSDRLQFYETDQEYVERLEQEAEARRERIEEEVRNEQNRFDELPPTLQTHIVMMRYMEAGYNTPRLILQAEQALTLAARLPSPNALNGMRHSTLDRKLSVLSKFMDVDGWDENQADGVFDLAIFYLETRDM